MQPKRGARQMSWLWVLFALFVIAALIVAAPRVVLWWVSRGTRNND